MYGNQGFSCLPQSRHTGTLGCQIIMVEMNIVELYTKKDWGMSHAHRIIHLFARRNELRIIFNRESARWAKIKYEAEVLYQKWLNPILTKMSADADVELFDSICKKVEMKGSLTNMEAEAKKTRENYKFETGNGGMESGIGTSAFTMGTQ